MATGKRLYRREYRKGHAGVASRADTVELDLEAEDAADLVPDDAKGWREEQDGDILCVYAPDHSAGWEHYYSIEPMED